MIREVLKIISNYSIHVSKTFKSNNDSVVTQLVGRCHVVVCYQIKPRGIEISFDVAHACGHIRDANNDLLLLLCLFINFVILPSHLG